MYGLNCKGILIDLSTPKIMGILNVTPDSFYDGGRYQHEKSQLLRVEQLLKEGATFIDMGACSSKPKARFVSENEEAKRLFPILEAVIKAFPKVLVSVDTFRSGIAQEAVNRGAALVNDIYGGDADVNMFDTIARLQVPYIATHIQGTPQNMQDKPTYDDVVLEVYQALSQKQHALREKGVKDVIFDVGFGFGKTLAHNYQLLQNLDYFQRLSAPILTGISRKSMIYKLLNNEPENALNGTAVAHTIALMKGSQILRTHDVRPAMEAIRIVQACKDFN